RIRNKPHITDVYVDVIRNYIPIKNTDYRKVNNGLDKYILIHPFAGTNPKEWGIKKFLDLAKDLNKERECFILIPPQTLSEDLLSEIKSRNLKTIETKTINELIEVIESCYVFIGNDSGPIHIANLLGKPTFTIYGPTNPIFHKPLFGPYKYAYKEIKCSPLYNEKLCFTHGGVLDCPSFECMNTLTLAEVKENITEFLMSLKKQSFKKNC
ncbi:MAG TPA: glycosyltransferase family 9 protein, partial [Ignavibacteriaceae bacterium]|nr:glycosyltransferase family 9 protein [Ignavibacteriaceae bacterium]